MKTGWLISLLLAALCCTSIALAQPVPSSGSSQSPTKRSQGFLDYALGKVNPHDRDYGTVVESVREVAVANTIQNLYFWSNVVSITLLSATSVALFLVLRTQSKREHIAATLISQLWNGRCVDRREIVRRTEMYNTLVETKNAKVVNQTFAGKDASAKELGFETTASRQLGKRARVQGEVAAPKTPSSTGEIGIPSMEQEQKTRLLEGQNQALRNSERNLRERLNQVSQDLEQERRRNQTLKGA